MWHISRVPTSWLSRARLILNEPESAPARHNFYVKFIPSAHLDMNWTQIQTDPLINPYSTPLPSTFSIINYLVVPLFYTNQPIRPLQSHVSTWYSVSHTPKAQENTVQAELFPKPRNTIESGLKIFYIWSVKLIAMTSRKHYINQQLPPILCFNFANQSS